MDLYRNAEAERKRNDVMYQVFDKMEASVLKMLLKRTLRVLETDLGKDYERLTELRGLDERKARFADWSDVKGIFEWASEQDDHHLLLYLWFGLHYAMPKIWKETAKRVTDRESFLDFWLPKILCEGFKNRFRGVYRTSMNQESPAYVEAKLPMKAFVLDLAAMYEQSCMTKKEWKVCKERYIERGKKHAIAHVPRLTEK